MQIVSLTRNSGNFNPMVGIPLTDSLMYYLKICLCYAFIEFSGTDIPLFINVITKPGRGEGERSIIRFVTTLTSVRVGPRDCFREFAIVL